MCIKSDSTSKKLKTDITRWPLSYKPNLMKNKQNVMKLSNNSKNLRDLLLKTQSSVGPERKSLRKCLMNGKKWMRLKTRKSISIDFRISL